jgi:hypothetical protein
VWEPADRPVYAFGELQALQSLSEVLSTRRHWKVEPLSEEEKAKLAEVLVTVPEGPELMVVSGGGVIESPVEKYQE